MYSLRWVQHREEALPYLADYKPRARQGGASGRGGRELALGRACECGVAYICSNVRQRQGIKSSFQRALKATFRLERHR